MRRSITPAVATPSAAAFATAWHRRSSETLTLGAIAIVLLALKASFNPFPYSETTNFVDGAFYYQVATHVANGDGLMTGVSLYNSGFRELPHTVTFYPLWPLLLGAVGAVIGMSAAASLVPEALYFCALALVYVLANRVAAAFGSSARTLMGRPIRLTPGHAAVLMLGLNHVFFRFTSLPFTEGLAFTIALTLLLLIEKTAERPDRPLLAVAVGGVAGLAYLVRAQFIVLMFVAPVVFMLGALWGRKQYWRAALLSLAVGSAFVIGWGLFLISSLENFRPAMLVDAAAVHETPALARFQSLVPASSTAEALQQVAHGLVTAFSYGDQLSYVRSFGVLTYLVPVAAIWALSRRSFVTQAGAMMNRPAGVLALASALTAAVTLGPIHIAPFVRGEWSFYFRQGLPYVFALLVAMPFLASRHVAARVGVLLCLAAFLAASVSRLGRVFEEDYRPTGRALIELAEWIGQQPVAPVFVSRNGSTRAAATNGRFHYIYCDQSVSDVRTYLTELKVNYLLTAPGDANCEFFRTLSPSLAPVRSFGAGERMLTAWRWSE